MSIGGVQIMATKLSLILSCVLFWYSSTFFGVDFRREITAEDLQKEVQPMRVEILPFLREYKIIEHWICITYEQMLQAYHLVTFVVFGIYSYLDLVWFSRMKGSKLKNIFSAIIVTTSLCFLTDGGCHPKKSRIKKSCTLTWTGTNAFMQSKLLTGKKIQLWIWKLCQMTMFIWNLITVLATCKYS